MSEIEYDLFIKGVKVATFYEEEWLKIFLFRMDYIDGEIKVIPYAINDLGERIEIK